MQKRFGFGWTLTLDFCSKIEMGKTTRWESYLYNMNITNSFFFVSAIGERDSRFKSTEQTIKLDYDSWVYPLDKLGHTIPLNSKASTDDSKGKEGF